MGIKHSLQQRMATCLPLSAINSTSSIQEKTHNYITRQNPLKDLSHLNSVNSQFVVWCTTKEMFSQKMPEHWVMGGVVSLESYIKVGKIAIGMGCFLPFVCMFFMCCSCSFTVCSIRSIRVFFGIAWFFHRRCTPLLLMAAAHQVQPRWLQRLRKIGWSIRP